MNNSFRRIDIDRYDEDNVLEEELYDADPRDPEQVLSETRAKAQQVRSALAKGDTTSALNIVLEDAPYGWNAEEAKTTNMQTLLSILSSTRTAEISNIVKTLSQDAQDMLMKYLYKGMAMESFRDVNGSVLLSWHEKLTEVAGTGCIVRVMTDRRTV